MCRSVPQLLALSQGITCVGPHQCFYCGASCAEDYPAATHVKVSFTGRSGVAAPASPWVCGGCVLCLRESADITLIDGECRTGQMMRGYSWVITTHSAIAATKAHVDRLRELCLHPPEPPFAIVISDSGQTHQLYRGVLNIGASHDDAKITLEAEVIRYRPRDLEALLVISGRLAAVIGKPGLREPLEVSGAMKILARYHDGEELIDQWSRAGASPLGRLATWLTPPKAQCEELYPQEALDDDDRSATITTPIDDPRHRGVAEDTGGTGGPIPVRGQRGRRGRNESDSQPTLFDLGSPVR